MPEMATLDAFFNRIGGPVSTAEQQQCKTSNNEKNHKDTSRKRGRDSDSTAQARRLQKKRQKPLDSNLNVSKCAVEVDVAPEVVSNCQSCSQTEVQDVNVSSVPSSAIEISYEEFLTAKGIAHVETSLGSSEDADSDVETEVKMTPVETSLEHSGLASEPIAKSLKKSENSHDEDECEENVLSNNAEGEVTSKDIRSFFAKADKVPPQPVSAGTLMKVRADIHCQQSQKQSASSKYTEGRMKTGSDLARRQRAAIVITDDDLDIEVIDVSQSDEDLQVDSFLEDGTIDSMIPESSTGKDILSAELENTSSVCSEVFVSTDDCKKSAVERDSVAVGNVELVEKSADSARELSLTTAHLEEASHKAEVHTLEEAVLNRQEDCDHDEADEVIMVDEKGDKANCKADCDDLSATEPSTPSIRDGQSDVPLATKSRKPEQVRHFGTVFCQ